jgi:hypothetical protein
MGYITTMPLYKIPGETFIIVWQQLPKFRNKPTLALGFLELPLIIVYDKKTKPFVKQIVINLKEDKEENTRTSNSIFI